MTISKFQGEYRWLSNFHMIDIILDGVTYPSTEHAFQAAKTLDPQERAEIRRAGTPGLAKKLGRKVKLRPDWEKIKIQVMEDLNWQKFQEPDLKAALLMTEDEELIEGNTWHDVFWGVCDGTGQNQLGKILMRIRSKLKG